MSSQLPVVQLRFEGGTLVLEDNTQRGLPRDAPHVPSLAVQWDDRVQRHRAPAWHYREIVTHYTRAARAGIVQFNDQARRYEPLNISHRAVREPYAHQRDAVAAWVAAGKRGVVVLPTGAGKSYVAEMAIANALRSCLVIAPTIDLMNQWYDVLSTAFDTPIGLLGGGYHEILPITVSTYDSASLHMEHLGQRFGLLVFDECHHLPSPGYLLAAECSIAPYRLGLTATLERSDGRESLLDARVGNVVYRREIKEMTGAYLADYEVVQMAVSLRPDEAERYTTQREVYKQFLREKHIEMSRPDGWSRFIMLSSRSQEGRRAMMAYREQRQIAIASRAKLEVLEGLLRQHARERTLVFTNDNDTVYLIARTFLIPALTHQTDTKERREILARFNRGDYPAIVTSRVLNEGVNIPEASVAIVLSGTGSVREHVQRLGRILRKQAGKRAILYEVVAADTVEERVSDRRREHDAYR